MYIVNFSVKKIFIIICLLKTAKVCSGYNVLVTTVSVAASQNLVMYRLAELLAERGHHVTVLNADVFAEAKRPTLRYVKEEFKHTVIPDPIIKEEIRLGMQDNAWNSSSGPFHQFSVIRNFFGQLSNSCRTFIADETTSSVFHKLKSRKFDVIVIHMMDFCSFGLAHKLDIKGTIWMSTAFSIDFMSWYAGAPTPVSYVPAGPNPMPTTGFISRLSNAFFFLVTNAVFQYGIVQTYTAIFQERYGVDFPSLGELLHKTQLHFINSDPFFEYPRPVLHKMIYVGGLTMENPEPLDVKWQKIVKGSIHGMVVFSFGSVANTSFMPLEWKLAFINAFRRIKQTVIWRLEGDTRLAEEVPNIIATDWIPQRDIMAQSNVKALITHGGYNSLTEATYMGVPLIMLPLFGDQYSNCKRVERLNVGVILGRNNLTSDSIYAALIDVVNNETIQSNARRLGRMIRKKPHSSKQAALEWVEFLAEFQDLSQLSPKGQELNLIEYFMIDIFVCIVFIMLILSYGWFYLLFKICSKCYSRCQKLKTD